MKKFTLGLLTVFLLLILAPLNINAEGEFTEVISYEELVNEIDKGTVNIRIMNNITLKEEILVDSGQTLNLIGPEDKVITITQHIENFNDSGTGQTFFRIVGGNLTLGKNIIIDGSEKEINELTETPYICTPSNHAIKVSNSGHVKIDGATIANFEPHLYVSRNTKAPIIIDNESVLELISGSIENNTYGYEVEENKSVSTLDAKQIKNYIANLPMTNTAGAIYADHASHIYLYDNFSINNNKADCGAIILTFNSTLDMYGGLIDSNIGVHHSGGVLVEDGSKFTLHNGKISNNIAWNKGGAVWVTGWGTNGYVEKDWDSWPKEYPKVTNGYKRIQDGIFIMRDGVLDSNLALVRGGAINVESNEVYLYGGTIKNNVSRSLGGAIYVEGDSPSYSYTLVLGSATFKDNKTYSSSSSAPLSYGVINSKKTLLNQNVRDRDFPQTGGGAGLWLCPIGGSSAIYGNSADFIDNQAAIQGTDIYLNKSNGELLLIDSERFYSNESTNKPLAEQNTPAGTSYFGFIPIIENKTQPPVNSELIFENNQSLAGGAIAANGMVYLGSVQDVTIMKPMLTLKKTFDDQPEPGTICKFKLYYYDLDGAKKLIQEIEMDGVEDSNPDQIEGESASYEYTLPIPSYVEIDGVRKPLFTIHNPSGGTVNELTLYIPEHVNILNSLPTDSSGNIELELASSKLLIEEYSANNELIDSRKYTQQGLTLVNTKKVILSETPVLDPTSGQSYGDPATVSAILLSLEDRIHNKSETPHTEETQITVSKIWKDKDGIAVPWPQDVPSITINVLYGTEIVETIELSENNPTDSITLPKLSGEYTLEEVPISGYITSKDQDNNFVNTKIGDPEIEKYVKEAVHKGILIDEEFEYEILAFVPKGATELTITDNLVDELEFISSPRQIKVAVLDSNNHKVTYNKDGEKINNDASVSLNGNPLSAAEIKISDDKKLTIKITPPNPEDIWDKWIKVSYFAKIDEYTKCNLLEGSMTIDQLPFVTVEGNKVFKSSHSIFSGIDEYRPAPNVGNVPVRTAATHTGIENTASYVVSFVGDLVSKDESNTVTVLPSLSEPSLPEPELQTTAINKDDGDKIISNKQATIVDTIAYANLDPKSTYKIEGKLVTKSSNGKNVVATNFIDNFKPSNTSSEVKMEFSFDASNFNNQELVVFEYLLLNNEIIAMHEDINDESQTVKVSLITERPELEKYVNKGVTANFKNFDQTFTFDILGFIPSDATYVEFNDNLNELLDFADDVNLSVDALTKNDHYPKGSVLDAGTIVEPSTATALNKKLTVIFDENSVNQILGKWVRITFNAKFDPSNYKKLIDKLVEKENSSKTPQVAFDNEFWKNIEDNEPVISQQKHDGVINDAILKVNTSNTGNFTVQSNIVTVEPEMITFKAEKKWKDADGFEVAWPNGASIRFALMRDNQIIEERIITQQETVVFSPQPKLANSNYKIIENFVGGIASELIDTTVNSDSTWVFTNKLTPYIPEVFDITVNKIWDDDNNRDGIRPQNITVTLTGSNGYSRTETFTNSYTFTNLNKTDSEGNLITYSINEKQIDGYTTRLEKVTDTEFKLINEHTPEAKNITVNKVWNDSNNRDGFRPQSLTVTLTGSDGSSRNAVLSEENNWSYEFTDLPVNLNSSPIVYEVSEPSITPYTSSVNGYTLTNSYEPEDIEITVNKIWNDNNNQDSLRPENITIRLFANGVEVDSVTLTNETSHTFTDLPKYKDAKLINYTILEDSVDNYDTSIEGFTVTNTYTPEKTSYSVNKTWSDSDNQDGIRPNSILVQLYANDEPIGDVIEINNSYTWHNLDLNKEGVPINYSVKEVNVPDGYTDSYEYKHGISEITNTHEPQVTRFTVKKIWDDEDNKFESRPTHIQVILNGSDGSKHPLELSGDFIGEFNNLPMYFNGTPINYELSEFTVEGYEEPIIVKEGNDFTITNKRIKKELPVSFSKTSINGTEEIPGAILEIYEGDSLVEEWVSGDKPYEVDLLPGEYRLVEHVAPDNYDLAEDIYFRVTEDLKLEVKVDGEYTEQVIVQMKDAPLESVVKISKKSINGTKELPGATLVVEGKNFLNEDVRIEWVSGNELKEITLLPGSYTLTEITAPNGYEVAESIEFIVDGKGNVTSEFTEEGVVVMRDVPIEEEPYEEEEPKSFEVEISKVDLEQGNELKGAELTVKGIDVKGNKVDIKWISASEPKKLQLLPGAYTLTENQAPLGYEIAESIEFVVRENGDVLVNNNKVEKVVMKDKLTPKEDKPEEPKPETPKPEQPKPTTPQNPTPTVKEQPKKTQENSNTPVSTGAGDCVIYVGLLLISSLVFTAILTRK